MFISSLAFICGWFFLVTLHPNIPLKHTSLCSYTDHITQDSGLSVRLKKIPPPPFFFLKGHLRNDE